MKQLIFQKCCKLDEVSAEISKTDSEYLTLLIAAVPAAMTEFCKCSIKKLLKMRSVRDFMSILFQIF